MSTQIELVTFGEAMVRFSPPGFRRLEQTTSLEVFVGGSELNAAVAAARLGLNTSFVTRLTRNPLGRMVENRAREHGIDTSKIIWTDTDRIGTYYVEPGASPRANAVIYDRANSAIACIEPGEIDWGSVFLGARLFYTSGITPALSRTAAEATLDAIRHAREAGVTVCVDLNYRRRLWSQSEAKKTMSQIALQTDILFATEEDTSRVFGITGSSYESVARQLANTFDLRVVAITLRKNPSVWRNQWTAIAYDAGTDTIHTAPAYDIEVVDRIGSGDAFVGGFLYGFLTDGTDKGLRYGVALSALKQTVPGDIGWATRDELEQFLEGGGLRIQR